MSLSEPQSTTARPRWGHRSIAFGGTAAVTAASLFALPSSAQAETVANVATAYAVSGPNVFSVGESNVFMVGTSDGRYLFANDFTSNAVSRADTATPNTVSSITGISGVSSVALSADATYVIATRSTDSRYTRILVSDNSVTTHSLAATSEPVDVAISGTSAYFAEHVTNQLERVDLTTNAASGSVSFGTDIPTAVELSNGGSYAWVAANTSNKLFKVDTATMTIAQTITGAPTPMTLAVSPDNSRLLFTSTGYSNRLYSLNISTGAITSFSLPSSGSRSLTVAVDPQSTFAYVGKYGSESVKVNLATGDTSTFAESGSPENAAFFFPTTGSDANKYAYAAQTSGLPLVKVAISPSAPTPVDGTRGDSQVALTWTTPTYPGAASITDHTVQYSTDNATWTAFPHGASTATAMTVTGLTNGTPYYFRVAGVSTAGTGLFAYMTGTRTPATVPGAPTGITASAGPGQLTAGWTAPASNGGEGITNYVVEYSTNNTTWTPVTRATSTSTSQVITGLTSGTPHYIRVAAVNAVGTGAWGTGGTWSPSTGGGGTGGGGGGTPTDPTPPGGSPGDDPTPSIIAASAATPQATSTAPTAIPSIANARVIYRMKPTGVWEVVPRFNKAARAIPANALFTAVRSPIAGQSKNIPAALTRSQALATAHVGYAHPAVLKGKLWRGRARIIVNW